MVQVQIYVCIFVLIAKGPILAQNACKAGPFLRGHVHLSKRQTNKQNKNFMHIMAACIIAEVYIYC